MRRRRNRRTGDEPLLFTHDDELPDLSAYRSMWLFAMFDLPVTEKEMKKRYTRFRKALLTRGFTMLQFSVYARHCGSEDSAEGVRRDVRTVLPPDGQVRLLAVTDRQFGKMEVYFGKKRRRTEEPPAQFMLF